MKKIIVICIIILENFSIIVAQKLSETDSLYWIALDHYTKQKLRDTTIKERILYIGQSYSLDTFPETMNSYKIIRITNENEDAIFRVHKNKLIWTKISNPEIDHGELSIIITPYDATYTPPHKSKRYGLLLSFSCWYFIVFKYDCESRRFIFDRSGVGCI